MGFKLRREVRDRLPPGLLTAGERCLVLEVADSCDDDSREGWPGAEWLAEKADVAEAKVGDMFNRIGKKWVELRVPLGTGKDGRPYYSRPRKRTKFRFPPTNVLDALRAKAPQDGGPNKAPESGGPKPPQAGGPKAPQNREGRSPNPGGPSPQGSPQRTSSKNSSPLSPDDDANDTRSASAQEPQARERGRSESEPDQPAKPLPQRLISKRGWSDTNAKILQREIENMHYIENMGWWVTVDKNGTLDDIITDAVAENRARAEAYRQQQTAPDIEDPWEQS